MKRVRTYHELDGADRSALATQVGAQRERVRARLASVRHIVAVMSGKGGVGKSFVTAGLATALARAGRSVGVLDGDLHGPTAARMLRVPAAPLVVAGDAVEAALAPSGVRVMSSDLLLGEGAPLRFREPSRERFVWRGTLESGVLREFLGDVHWGELDALLVDLPPGTDRLLALVDFLPRLAGVVVVTIPSLASYRAVRRAVEVARGAPIPVLGVVENMSGYRCAECGSTSPLFAGDAGERLAAEAGAPLLGRVPFEPRAQEATDAGVIESAGEMLEAAAGALLACLEAP